jgi:hypothetical protein
MMTDRVAVALALAAVDLVERIEDLMLWVERWTATPESTSPEDSGGGQGEAP